MFSVTFIWHEANWMNCFITEAHAVEQMQNALFILKKGCKYHRLLMPVMVLPVALLHLATSAAMCGP